jgi:hypothetical protein
MGAKFMNVFFYIFSFLFFPSSCELFLSPPTQKKNSSGTSLAFSLSLLSQAGFCFCLVKKNIHTISRHIKNKKNARDEKAERAVNSRRAFLPCSSSLSRPRLGARASFCDAIIKNREREREREEYFVRTKQKGKKKCVFSWTTRTTRFVRRHGPKKALPTKQG